MGTFPDRRRDELRSLWNRRRAVIGKSQTSSKPRTGGESRSSSLVSLFPCLVRSIKSLADEADHGGGGLYMIRSISHLSNSLFSDQQAYGP